MHNNRYTQTIDLIKAPESVIEKMIQTARNYESKESRKVLIINMNKIALAGICILFLVAMIRIIGLDRNWSNGQEFCEQENEGENMTDVEPQKKTSLIDADIEKTFGYLFPSEIEQGYSLSPEGINVYGESPQILKALYYNERLDDFLVIAVAPDNYFNDVEYDSVIYGDMKSDGSRSSMVYYQNNGMTIMYQFEKTDIAKMNDEESERFYAMVHSAKCFDNSSHDIGFEGNDEADDIDITSSDHQ